MEIFKNKLRIVEIIIVFFALIASPLLAVLIVGYLLYIKNKMGNLNTQLKSALEEDETNQVEFEMPFGTPEKFLPYKECVIEKYGKKFYIMKPSGETLKKVFNEAEDAKAEIDAIYPFLSKTPRERQKIHNVRFVK